MRFPLAGPSALVLAAFTGWTLGRRPVETPGLADQSDAPSPDRAAAAETRPGGDASELARQVRAASLEELEALLAKNPDPTSFHDAALAMLAAQRLREMGHPSSQQPYFWDETDAWGLDRLRALAAKDPHAAIAQATDDLQFAAIAEDWARQDAAAATAWVLSLPSDCQEVALGPIASIIAGTSVDAAKAWVEALPDRSVASAAMTAVATKWAESAPADAITWHATMDRANTLGFTRGVVSRRTDWGAKELLDLFSYRGDTAFSGDKTIPQQVSVSRGSMVIGETGGWLAANLRPSDPARLVADLAEMPASEARQQILRAAVNAWVAQDSAAALSAAEKATDPWVRLAFLNGILATETVIDSPETLARVVALAPNEMAVDQVTARYWQKQAETDPAEAERQLARNLSADAARSLAVELARQKSRTDPAAAVAWAIGLTGTAQEAALLAAAPQWAEHDPSAATAWLASQSEGAGRDLAIKATLSALEPAAALPWAEAISDAAVREQAVTDYLLNLDGPKGRALRLVDSLRTATPEFRANLRKLLQ